jgi:hypothetical protein
MDGNNTTQRPTVLASNLYSSSEWTVLRSRRLGPKEGMRQARFLLGKFLFTEEGAREDLLELFNLVFLLGNISESTFVRKYGFLLTCLLNLDYRNLSCFTKQLRQLKVDLPRILPHKREFFSQKVTHQSHPTLSLVFRKPRSFPPKKVIGVGYDDKGSLRIRSTHGDPSWTEVAMDEWFQSHATMPLRFMSPIEGLRWSGVSMS